MANLRTWAYCLAAALMSGCATAGQAIDFLHRTPAGATLELRKAYEIPAGTASVYFQGGRVVSYVELDEYYPHCWLVSKRVAETVRAVAPARYRIRRVVYGEDDIVRRPLQLASNLTIGGGSPRTSYRFNTRLDLEPWGAPTLLYLECGQLADYAIGRHISVQEFRQAVGAYMSIRP
jgi:hypothetical protein